VDELAVDEVREDDHERHNGDVSRCGDAGHEEHGRGEKALAVVVAAHPLDRLVGGDEESQMGRG